MNSRIGLDNYSEDVEAINRFFGQEHPKTEAASAIAIEWATWYSLYQSKGWFDRSFNSDLWDQARKLRDKYNLANAVTETEKNAVLTVQKTGLRAEDLGQAKPLGGALGDLPSNIARGDIGSILKGLPTPAKVGLAGLAGFMLYKVLK
jgi:hypothetical protein